VKSPVSPPRPRTDAATPGPPGRLIAGHFTDGVCLDTWRRAGTRDWFLTVTVGGRGRVGYEGGDVLTGRGDVVLLRPGTLHDYGSEKLKRAWEFYWVHFLPKPEWMAWLQWPEVAPGIFRVRLKEARRAAAIRQVCTVLVRRNISTERHGEALALNALEEILIRCDQANPKSAPDAQDPRVQRALDYLMLHFSELLTIPALAKICGLSPARFTRLFHRETGLPPIRYLEEIRLTRACRLLALTQDKIASIAGQVGFENPFYFTLRFKRYTGQSPSQYRQNHATGEHEKGAGQIT